MQTDFQVAKARDFGKRGEDVQKTPLSCMRVYRKTRVFQRVPLVWRRLFCVKFVCATFSPARTKTVLVWSRIFFIYFFTFVLVKVHPLSRYAEDQRRQMTFPCVQSNSIQFSVRWCCCCARLQTSDWPTCLKAWRSCCRFLDWRALDIPWQPLYPVSCGPDTNCTW